MKVVERLLAETEALPQAGQRIAHQLVLGVDDHVVIHAGEQRSLARGILCYVMRTATCVTFAMWIASGERWSMQGFSSFSITISP